MGSLSSTGCLVISRGCHALSPHFVARIRQSACSHPSFKCRPGNGANVLALKDAVAQDFLPCPMTSNKECAVLRAPFVYPLPSVHDYSGTASRKPPTLEALLCGSNTLASVVCCILAKTLLPCVSFTIAKDNWVSRRRSSYAVPCVPPLIGGAHR